MPASKPAPAFNAQFTDKKFYPYALAIGQAALAWNYLHEVLCEIFVVVVDSSYSNERAIWYSQGYDRARRKMLLAALQKNFTHTHPWPKDNYLPSIEWMLAETTKLEDARNITIHAPLVIFDEELAKFFGKETGVVPYDLYGNPNATRLTRKDILAEFRWLRDRALVLAEFGLKVRYAWVSQGPLPDRPRLPTREDRKSRRGHRNQRGPK